MPALGRCPEEEDTFASMVLFFVRVDNSPLNFKLLSLDFVVCPDMPVIAVERLLDYSLAGNRLILW